MPLNWVDVTIVDTKIQSQPCVVICSTNIETLKLSITQKQAVVPIVDTKVQSQPCIIICSTNN